jgi:DNA topoisomerase-3
VANLVGDEKKVYEYITRRFLACCAKDAEGWETSVEVMCGGDAFHASGSSLAFCYTPYRLGRTWRVIGLVVKARNYLDVYPYDSWVSKSIPDFTEDEQFEPSVCELKEGRTTSPSMLNEADLVGLMDKNGIGKLLDSIRNDR